MEANIGKKIILLSFSAFLAVFVFFEFFSVSAYKALAEDEGDIKDSIEKIENKLEKEEKAKLNLEKELQQIQGSVSYTQAQINKTESMIEEAENSIKRKEKEIDQLQKKIMIQKEILKGLMQDVYYSKKNPLLYAILNVSNVSSFMGNSDRTIFVNDKISEIVEEIDESLGDIEEDKTNIEENKEEHERLLDMKEAQHKALVSDKTETQTEIKQKDATIGELNAKLSKLRSNLSSYLGKSYDAKDISDAAKFASKVTGVRKDFLMGMLVVESDLGRFTGGCTADKSNMSKYRLGIFKDICESLDYNWKKQKVSCPPKSYNGTGGAMGVAQFMSDTWMGYKASIASKTGHNPPDPWNLTDGVTGMALKLAKGGATSKSGECNAAKLYLSGTTSSKYQWYCDRVKYWADNYESKLGG